MRFGRYWGMIVSSLASADVLESSPVDLRALFDEVEGQFPGVPVALAGRLPSLAASTGVGLPSPFTHGDRGTVCAMAGAAREASSLLGREPTKVNIAVVGSKGFIGSRLVSSLSNEFGTVIALDSRYDEACQGEHGVFFTNRPEDLGKADVIFVLTPRGTDVESLVPHIAPGAIVADDTYPEMPESLRVRIEERGAQSSKRLSRMSVFVACLRYRISGPMTSQAASSRCSSSCNEGPRSSSPRRRSTERRKSWAFGARLAPHRNRAKRSPDRLPPREVEPRALTGCAAAR
jgi:Predicted dehydrogenase